MRLLLLTQYFWPENFRINELAVELERRGHQVTEAKLSDGSIKLTVQVNGGTA